MAEISKLASNGHHTFYLTVDETYVDTINNQSTVSWSFGIESVNSSWDFYIIGGTIKINMNGEEIFNEYKQRDHNAKGRTIWASGTKIIKHNSDGQKWLDFSFDYSQSSGMSSWTPGNASTSGGMALTNIPRYVNITSFTVSKRDETSVTFNHSADAECDYAWYSIDNGLTWHNLPVDNIVKELNPNQTYNFKLRLRRKDSQLTTDSWTVSQTTYDYPHPTSINNFTIGDGASVAIYNPLGRSYTLDIISNNSGGVIGSYSGTYQGTVNAEFKTPDAINKQYASIPNSQSGTYYARVTYGSSVRTKGNATYYINSTECLPTFNNYEFEDTNEEILRLTGDNSRFVLGKSNLRVIISPSNKAMAKNSSTMKEYQLGNDTNNVAAYSSTENVYLEQKQINSSEITIYARDSRLLTTGVTKPINNVGYTEPIIDIINAKAIRNNNGVGSQVTLNFDGTYWNQSFGLVANKIKKLTYKYKRSDSTTSFSEEFDITDNIIYNDNVFKYNSLIQGDNLDLGFDISESYNIVVYYEDELTKGMFSLILKSGAPSIAIAKNGVSIKGKYDAELGGALQVHGDLVINDGQIIDNSGRNGVVLYENSSGSTGTISLNETSANFSAIEVIYGCDNYTYSTGKIYEPNNKNIATPIQQVQSSNDQVSLFVSNWTISGTSITFVKASNKYIASTIQTYGTNAYIKIYKVVGYNTKTYEIGDGRKY